MDSSKSKKIIVRDLSNTNLNEFSVEIGREETVFSLKQLLRTLLKQQQPGSCEVVFSGFILEDETKILPLTQNQSSSKPQIFFLIYRAPGGHEIADEGRGPTSSAPKTNSPTSSSNPELENERKAGSFTVGSSGEQPLFKFGESESSKISDLSTGPQNLASPSPPVYPNWPNQSFQPPAPPRGISASPLEGAQQEGQQGGVQPPAGWQGPRIPFIPPFFAPHPAFIIPGAGLFPPPFPPNLAPPFPFALPPDAAAMFGMGAAGQPGAMQRAGRRRRLVPVGGPPLRIHIRVDVMLILKLVVVVMVLNQEGSLTRFFVLSILASLVYLYQTGALVPLLRSLGHRAYNAVLPLLPAVLLQLLQRMLQPAPPPVPAAVPGGQVDQNGAPAAAGQAAGVAGVGGRGVVGGVPGVLGGVQQFVVGFLASLLPGYQGPAGPGAVAGGEAAENREVAGAVGEAAAGAEGPQQQQQEEDARPHLD